MRAFFCFTIGVQDYKEVIQAAVLCQEPRLISHIFESGF